MTFKQLESDVLETVWRDKDVSTLFALLPKVNLRTQDEKLLLLAQSLQELAQTKGGTLPLHLYAQNKKEEDFPQRLDPDEAYLLLFRQRPASLPKATKTHNLWIEGSGDVTLATYIPLSFEESPQKKAPDPLHPHHLRQNITEEGLYTLHLSFCAPAAMRGLLRVRQMAPAFPVTVRGLVIDTEQNSITPYNSVAIDLWSYHLRSYSDALSLCLIRQGDVLDIKTRLRLDKGAKAFVDFNPVPRTHWKDSLPLTLPENEPKILALSLTKAPL
ncbi:MAG TPA: hypothetical protein DD400_01775 [Rhodospirillaceae bacterium]|nr:hypothetical protein [Rhodospirillaceae bacterium]